METADTVIRDVLQEITLQASEQEIEAVDFYTANRYMNRFMAELDAKGCKLGWTETVNPADPITIPAGAINGLIYNTAKILCNTYAIELTIDLVTKAKDSYNTMMIIGNPPPSSKYPSTMPIGSGNQLWGNTGGYVSKFYDGCCEDNPAACGE